MKVMRDYQAMVSTSYLPEFQVPHVVPQVQQLHGLPEIPLNVLAFEPRLRYSRIKWLKFSKLVV